MRGYFRYLCKAIAHSFNAGWGLTLAVSTLCPFVLLALLYGNGGTIDDIAFLKWANDNQVLFSVYCGGATFIAYLFYAPYKFNKDEQAQHLDLMTKRGNEVDALRTELRYIREPRFEIECGEQTTSRDGTYTETSDYYLGGVGGPVTKLERKVPIAFFGFRLWNRGAIPAKLCRVRLVGIERDGRKICDAIAALPFEADNREDDLEVVDVPNDIPQRATVFSIYHSGQIAAGSANMKWRHPDIHPLFNKVGEYTFLVSISDQTDGKEKLTQHERFVCHWRGNHNATVIEYRGPNKYVPNK